MAFPTHQGSVVHLERGEVDLKQPILVVQVLDPTGHSIGLIVAPVIVLGIDWCLPDIKDRPVERDQLIVVVEVVEDVVHILLSG